MSNVNIQGIRHKWHGPEECAYFFEYPNDFGCIMEIQRHGTSTILVELVDGQYEEREKQMHYEPMEALLWCIKWRYYT